jgi:predicted ABC-type ATPase
MVSTPQVVIIAGPNGAGKTTSSEGLLRAHQITTFVNADRIASGLSGLSPDDAAIEAGILMLEKIRKLVSQRASFAFETTLASRTYGPWTRDRLAEGFQVHLHFIWLPSEDVAVERVAHRVRSGGHSIPEATIRRRFHIGLKNFFEQYRELATSWTMWNNSAGRVPQLIATRNGHHPEFVKNDTVWDSLLEHYVGRPKSS